MPHDDPLPHVPATGFTSSDSSHTRRSRTICTMRTSSGWLERSATCSPIRTQPAAAPTAPERARTRPNANRSVLQLARARPPNTPALRVPAAAMKPVSHGRAPRPGQGDVPRPHPWVGPIWHCCVPRAGGAVEAGWPPGQSARASSMKAAASRRCGSASSPSSWCPRRIFWIKACPEPITWAERNRFNPRIDRSRAFNLP